MTLNNHTQRCDFVGALLKHLTDAQLGSTDEGVVLRYLGRSREEHKGPGKAR